MREKFSECLKCIRVLISSLFAFLIPGLVAVCLFPDKSFAQQPDSTSIDSAIIDVAKVRFFTPMQNKAGLALLSRHSPDSDIAKLEFDRELLSRYQWSIPGSFIEKSVVLAFTLTNSSDSVKEVCFIPGFFCRNLNLFRDSETNKEIRKIPDSIAFKEKHKGSRTIRLMPGETG